ncbi:hypothetical protein [Paenibacillus sp. FSL R5-0810]|uniref:hypothetical protein n=1 Tax=Paenibacillus sp. FSL R5-0810 TaxID=2921659 RepID=UPI0030F88DD6
MLTVWEKEVRAAVRSKGPVMIRLMNGEMLQGIPESCTKSLVKLRRPDSVIWIPVEDIMRANRLLKINKKDPASE